MKNEKISYMLFFPEIIPAFIGVVAGPFWAIKIAQNGFIIQAIGLVICSIAGALWFGWSVAKDYRWLAWGSILFVLLSFLGINSTLPTSQGFLNSQQSQEKECPPEKTRN